jgi:hypothetical protein
VAAAHLVVHAHQRSKTRGSLEPERPAALGVRPDAPVELRPGDGERIALNGQIRPCLAPALTDVAEVEGVEPDLFRRGDSSEERDHEQSAHGAHDSSVGS